MANEDYISRATVKKAIDKMLEWIESDNRNNCDYLIVDKIEEIIKELYLVIGGEFFEEEEQEVCRDCISRKGALEALNLCDFARCNDFTNGATMLFEEDAKKRISELPSVRSVIEGTLELCEDCISREKTLERFCDYVGSGMSMNDYDALYDIVAKMPSVQPKTGWVSANERLPEEGKTVLVWYEYFRYGDYNCMWQTYGIGWQYDGHFSVDNGGASRQRVIAWCELPEEYKESEG